MLHYPCTTKVPIGDLDRDRSEEEFVQDIISRTLESLDSDDHDHDHDHDDFEDTDYDTDDSRDVNWRRWARNKRATDIDQREPVVNRGKGLVNLPAVQWPLVNQDDQDDNDSQDDGDDDEVAPLTAEKTHQRTVDYFRLKGSQLSRKSSVRRPAAAGYNTSVSALLVSQVSPDSVLTFTLASFGQHGRKSTTTRTGTAVVADATTTTTAMYQY
jgi:hypothetical protein